MIYKIIFLLLITTPSFAQKYYKNKDECKKDLYKKIKFPKNEFIDAEIMKKYSDKVLKQSCDITMLQIKVTSPKFDKCGKKEKQVICYRRLAYDYVNRNGISALGSITLAASSAKVVFKNKDEEIKNSAEADKKFIILANSALDLINLTYIDIFLFLKKGMNVHQMLRSLKIKIKDEDKPLYEKLIDDIENSTKENEPTKEQLVMLKTPAFTLYYLDLHEKISIKAFKSFSSKKIITLYSKITEKFIKIKFPSIDQKSKSAFNTLASRLATTTSILQNIFKVDKLEPQLKTEFEAVKDLLKDKLINSGMAAEAQKIQS